MRLKSLQHKCLGNMRKLGFTNHADSMENGQLAVDKQVSDDEDTEIEKVENESDTIKLDSSFTVLIIILVSIIIQILFSLDIRTDYTKNEFQKKKKNLCNLSKSPFLEDLFRPA